MKKSILAIFLAVIAMAQVHAQDSDLRSAPDLPTLAPQFTEDLKDIYIRQTRLQLVPSNGDLELEGEITGYDFAPMAVKEDAIASQTRLTITVRVRYSNRVNPDEDFEQSFSAYREFDSNLMPQQVEGTLCEEIIEEIVDQIYNATVANW